jgi:acetaldehyde dehydrogenase/alcohol dehydrogenase
MAHKLGAYHHLPHGICNALMMEEVIRFNMVEKPVKMGTFPQYDHPHTLRRYAEVAEALGCDGKDDKKKVENLIKKIRELQEAIEIKPSIKDYGIKEEDFLASLDQMALDAFDDQCTGANPRYPLVEEIKKMYLNAYYGKHEEV